MTFKDSEYIVIDGKPLQVMKFPGGEIQVRVPGISTRTPKIVARLTSSDAIMELLLTNNALYYEDILYPEVIIPYLPYARQDRVCSGGEAFSLEVISNIIYNTFDDITVWDVHSEVAHEWFSYSLKEIPQHTIFRANMPLSAFTHPGGVTIIGPDKGSREKIINLSANGGFDYIILDKVRNPDTGEITGLTLEDEVFPDKLYMIVDDICDGGRTFIETAKLLRERGATRVELYVTHGIFSKGFDVFKGLIDVVYYTNSLHGPISDKIEIIKKTI